MNAYPLLMAEEYWMDSQLSIARHFGRLNINGETYTIVNSEGIDIFTLSIQAKREGRDKAIPAGEPADLVHSDIISYYQKLGRQRLISVLKAHPTASLQEVIKHLKQLTT